MAAISGALANVAWAAPNNFNVTAGKFREFRLNLQNAAVDSTGFLDVVASHVAVVPGWSGSIEGMYPATPSSGATGIVTLTGGYTTNVTGWDLNIASASSTFAPLGGAWRTAVFGGPLVISGSFRCPIDGTTSITGVTAAAGSGAAIELAMTSTADDSFSGDVLINSADISAGRNGQPEVVYGFTCDGTFQGDDDTVLPGTLALPVPGLITLTATTGKTYAGLAGWSAVGVSVTAEDVIRVRASFTGSGALTIA